jgi:hypothetical protein
VIACDFTAKRSWRPAGLDLHPHCTTSLYLPPHTVKASIDLRYPTLVWRPPQHTRHDEIGQCLGVSRLADIDGNMSTDLSIPEELKYVITYRDPLRATKLSLD